MIPYVIICKSCAAKLKVSVPNLIGQTVDCPRCDTELTLTPPAGYQHPPAESDRSASSTFDDLDDVLGIAPAATALPAGRRKSASKQSSPGRKPDTPKESPEPALRTPTPQQRSKQTPAGGVGQAPEPTDPAPSKVDATQAMDQPMNRSIPVPRQKSISPKQTSETNSPKRESGHQKSGWNDSGDLATALLPDGSWDSAALKKRKRIIQVGSIGVLVCVLGVAGLALWSNQGSSTPRVSLSDSPNRPHQAQTSPADDSSKLPEPSGGSAAGSATGSGSKPAAPSITALEGPAMVDLNDGATSVRGAEDFAAPSIPGTGFDAPRAPLPSPPNQEDLKTFDPPKKVTETKTADDEVRKQSDTGDSFVKATPKESPLVPTRKSLSEFARALEESGTILSELKDQALLQREAALIGLPKYFVEAPDEDPYEVAKRLAVPVSGVIFDQSPVLDVLFELENLSGVPVSFDWDAGAVRSTDWTQTISLKATDESFESLFVTVAEKINLRVVADDRGVILTRSGPSEVSTRSWGLAPKLSDASVGELKNFIVRTWPLDLAAGDNALAARAMLAKSVVVTADRVSVSCDSDHFTVLNGLIIDMKDAAKPAAEQLLMVDSAVTPTVFQIDPVLARALDLSRDNPFRKPYRIGSLVRQIRAQAGLKIFPDWEGLRTLGWTPNTMIPGDFNEATCRDALEQLARSLKASWIVIDDSTVLLTSFESARSKSETEVYPVKHLLQKNLTSDELKRVLEDTLTRQLQQPGVSVVYFSECDCLVAYAPQAVHRQLYSILNRLWEDLK